MATDLMRVLRLCRNGWVLLLLSATPANSSAQAMADPTKPPAELYARPGAAAETSDLQSIIISPTRRAAIINGQTVELGAKVGDVRLIEVSESGVVLQGEKGLQVLTLFPNVKINKKTVVLPIEDDVKHSVRKERLVINPVTQGRKKEEK